MIRTRVRYVRIILYCCTVKSVTKNNHEGNSADKICRRVYEKSQLPFSFPTSLRRVSLVPVLHLVFKITNPCTLYPHSDNRRRRLPGRR